ncbi:MAG: hydroxymethylbilane synthase [Flavobacteriales bacterium]|nr:hydroxymethylbilane synthase [Flavobacteriales bacterium]
MNRHFIIGSRGSDLALWQSRYVQSLLIKWGFSSEIKIIQTQGDISAHLSFDKIEGKGFFTKEIEKALMDREIDIAVHSHKDLQTSLPDGLMIGALSSRASAEDVLLIRPDCFVKDGLFFLGPNPLIGTSSSRRKAQILDLIPSALVHDIRGNVPRRIEKLRQGDFEAIIIAKAGIERLNISLVGLHEYVFSVEEFVPAPAQGVLAIQCRNDDEDVKNALSQIHSKDAEECVWIEREILKLMDGGCHMPIGVFAEYFDSTFKVRIAYAPEVGIKLRKFIIEGQVPHRLVDNAMEFLKEGK